MPNKDYILDHVKEFSPQELAKFVTDGIVSFDELCNETYGEFSAPVQKEVKQLLHNQENAEDIDWDHACQENTIESYTSYLEKYPSGKYRREANDAIDRLEAIGADKESETRWRELDKNNINDLQNFIDTFPNSPHCKEAKRLISAIEDDLFFDTFDIDSLVEEIKFLQSTEDEEISDDIVKKIESVINDGSVTLDQFYSAVKNDKNLISPYVLQTLLDKHIISAKEFCAKTNIPPDVVRVAKRSKKSPDFDLPEIIKSPIEKPCTEIYFWGIPSSGKTCALGGILSVASSGGVAQGMDMDLDCQGYGYMSELSALFTNDDVIRLPPGTPTEAIYEMGFDLTDGENKIHPITCIDLAGELFEALHLKAAKKKLSDKQEIALKQLELILVSEKSGNRKIHFFVVEYGAHNKVFKGVKQDRLLNACMGFIKNRGVFDESTDAVYILVTKVDKIKERNKTEIIHQYLQDNYKGFYKNLLQLVKQCEINGGSVEIALFSLGRVYLQKYCKFNSKPSANIVQIMLDRSKGFKQDKFHKALKQLKK